MPTLAPSELVQRDVQAPQFEIVPDRPAELRVLPPSAERPFGALAVRLWTMVANPNPYGVTLLRVWGDLHLEGARAADVDFPLGVPLPARGEAIIPLDVVVDPRDVPEMLRWYRERSWGSRSPTSWSAASRWMPARSGPQPSAR